MVTRLQRYGISDEEYDSQAASQNYLCAICREANPHGKPLGVDHNHVTGANRGLLCDRCNKVLGFVRDSQELLLRLLFYARKHDGSQIPYVENNPETQAARDAAFEQSLSEVTRDPIKVPGEVAGVEPQ
jgi:Recombination endonuclease VII